MQSRVNEMIVKCVGFCDFIAGQIWSFLGWYTEKTLNLSPIQGLYAMSIQESRPFLSLFTENFHNFPSFHSI